MTKTLLYNFKKWQGQKNGSLICYTTYYWYSLSVTYDLLVLLYLSSVPASLISLTILFTLRSLISNLTARSAGAPVLLSIASLSILFFRVSFWKLFIITRFNSLAVDFEYKIKQKEEKIPRFLELFLGLFEIFSRYIFDRQETNHKRRQITAVDLFTVICFLSGKANWIWKIAYFLINHRIFPNRSG